MVLQEVIGATTYSCEEDVLPKDELLCLFEMSQESIEMSLLNQDDNKTD